MVVKANASCEMLCHEMPLPRNDVGALVQQQHARANNTVEAEKSAGSSPEADQ